MVWNILYSISSQSYLTNIYIFLIYWFLVFNCWPDIKYIYMYIRLPGDGQPPSPLFISPFRILQVPLYWSQVLEATRMSHRKHILDICLRVSCKLQLSYITRGTLCFLGWHLPVLLIFCSPQETFQGVIEPLGLNENTWNWEEASATKISHGGSMGLVYLPTFTMNFSEM